MMMNAKRIIASAVVVLGTIGTAGLAQAQVGGVDYSFNVPVAKVVSNPCTGGFTLVTGNAAVAINALQTTEFKLTATLTSSGSGADVTAAGLPLIGGGPNYLYSSDVSILATFPL